MIAEVLFPVALDKTFYYKIPDELKDKIKPGIRIYSSFANRKKVLGYVISIRDKADIDESIEIKRIDKIIDSESVFVIEKFIEISNYISKRWVSPLGMVLRDFLRFLPLKIDFNKNQIDLSNLKIEKRIIISSDTGKLIEKIKDNNDKCTVVFFPNIFSLELFSEILFKEGIEFKKYSSNEKTSQRKNISKGLIKNSVKVLLTTKAGCFLPFPPNAHFIITDPMNMMYRQFDQHPYYSAGDLIEKISDVFSHSITFFSSSMSLHLLKKKEAGWIVEDFSKKEKDFEVRDLKKERFDSDNFLYEIKKNIDKSKKVLILSYSKYLASVVYCGKCMWIKRCEKCGSIMKVEMVEGVKKYICGYCGFKSEYSNLCPHCKSVMEEKGSGAQKLYEILISRFPDKKIAEIDGRTLYSKNLFDYNFKTIIENDFNVLVATDIIATSTLNIKFDVAYLIMYESHNDFDYSFAERFRDKFSIISSKLNDDGKIFIYSYSTDIYVFNALRSNNYLEEDAMRKNFSYPPYSYLYRIEIMSKDKNLLKEKINELILFLKDDLKRKDLFIMDYIPGLKIKKLRGKKYYQHSSWVKLKDYNSFFDFLKEYCQKNKFILDAVEK